MRIGFQGCPRRRRRRGSRQSDKRERERDREETSGPFSRNRKARNHTGIERLAGSQCRSHVTISLNCADRPLSSSLSRHYTIPPLFTPRAAVTANEHLVCSISDPIGYVRSMLEGNRGPLGHVVPGPRISSYGPLGPKWRCCCLSILRGRRRAPRRVTDKLAK